MTPSANNIKPTLDAATLWRVLLAVTAFAVLLMGSFFTWLGITVVQLSNNQAAQANAIENLAEAVNMLQSKVAPLPPKDIYENRVRIEQLEKRMDDIERP